MLVYDVKDVICKFIFSRLCYIIVIVKALKNRKFDAIRYYYYYLRQRFSCPVTVGNKVILYCIIYLYIGIRFSIGTLFTISIYASSLKLQISFTRFYGRTAR